MTFALGSDVIGIDYTQLKKLCAVLGIDAPPPPPPPDSFDTLYQSEIHQKLFEMIDEKLSQNHRESHLIRNSDGSQPIEISVTVMAHTKKEGIDPVAILQSLES